MKFLIVLGLCVASISAGSIGTRGSFRQKPNLVSERAGRIIGGELAVAGQYPYAGAVYYTTVDGTYFCGGALINNEYFISGGHCVSGATSFTILLGRIDLQDTTTGLHLTTSTSAVHPDYNADTFANDIGIIKFRLPIEFTDYIQPVYLPTVDLTEGLQVTAIGWGATSDETTAPVDNLHYATVVVLTTAECQATYGNQLPANIACVAGGNVEGPCRGDLGAPLTINLNHHAWLVGVNSFVRAGASCEVPEPSGYTKIFPYLDWIRSATTVI